MPWVKLDDAMSDHPAISAVGLAAVGLFLHGICYSNRQLTDGFVPKAILRRYGGDDPQLLEAAMAELVTVAVFARVSRDGVDGFQIHQRYVSDQPSREDVERQRAAARKRLRRWRDGQKRQRNAVTNSLVTVDKRERNACPDPDPLPHPSVLQSKNTHELRARASDGFAGKRLRVSRRQHELVVAELGAAADEFDWQALYAAWDAQLCASGEEFDTLEFVKHAAHAQLASVQIASHAALSPRTSELLDECQRLHGGSCGGSLKHRTRMLIDEEKAKAVVA